MMKSGRSSLFSLGKVVPILIWGDGHKPQKENPYDRISDAEQAESGPEPEIGGDEKRPPKCNKYVSHLQSFSKYRVSRTLKA